MRRADSSVRETPIPVASLFQLLKWVEDHAREQGKLADEWRSSKPRRAVLEDALEEGLLRVEASSVALTPLGQALLHG
jgi:hypothetical protein